MFYHTSYTMVNKGAVRRACCCSHVTDDPRGQTQVLATVAGHFHCCNVINLTTKHKMVQDKNLLLLSIRHV